MERDKTPLQEVFRKRASDSGHATTTLTKKNKYNMSNRLEKAPLSLGREVHSACLHFRTNVAAGYRNDEEIKKLQQSSNKKFVDEEKLLFYFQQGYYGSTFSSFIDGKSPALSEGLQLWDAYNCKNPPTKQVERALNELIADKFSTVLGEVREAIPIPSGATGGGQEVGSGMLDPPEVSDDGFRAMLDRFSSNEEPNANSGNLSRQVSTSSVFSTGSNISMGGFPADEQFLKDLLKNPPAPATSP